MIKIEGQTFMRVTELCDFLGVSYPTLRKYRREGRIRGVKVGRRWVYSSREVKDFLNGGGEYFGGSFDPKTGDYAF